MQIISEYDNLSTWPNYSILDNSYKSYIPREGPREGHDAELDRHSIKTCKRGKAVGYVSPFLSI